MGDFFREVDAQYNLWVNKMWLVVSTPLKKILVNWDDDIPNIWDNKIDVPNHQPEMVMFNNVGKIARPTMFHWSDRVSRMKFGEI